MIRRATKWDASGAVIDSQDFASSEAKAMYAWASEGDYHNFTFEELDRIQKVPDRLLTDEDYWWAYRVIGHSGNGAVEFNATTRECDNPASAEDLAELETLHEKALAFPGVRTATTIGPMRARLKDGLT